MDEHIIAILQMRAEKWDTWAQVPPFVDGLRKRRMALGTTQNLMWRHYHDLCIHLIRVLGRPSCQALVATPYLLLTEKYLSPLWCRLGKNALSWVNEWMGFSYRALIFIPRHVPERMPVVPSHHSCRIATLSRADTVETIIGIIFTRSKRQSFPQAPKKHNPVLRFWKMVTGGALKSTPP